MSCEAVGGVDVDVVQRIREQMTAIAHPNEEGTGGFGSGPHGNERQHLHLISVQAVHRPLHYQPHRIRGHGISRLTHLDDGSRREPVAPWVRWVGLFTCTESARHTKTEEDHIR